MPPHEITANRMELHESQVLIFLPEVSDLVSIPEQQGDDDDDGGSLTFEDLMGMGDLSTGWIKHNFENKSNASCGIRPHQYEPSNAEQALFYASCPVLRPVRTQQKKKTKKKQRKEGRSAETSSGACPQSIVPINNQLDKKKKRSKKRPTMPMRSVSFSVKQESRAEPKKRPTMPVHSLSFSVAKETRTEPLEFPVVPRRAASFHSSFSSFHRDNLEGKERWNRREKSTSVCPVEFGASFSSSDNDDGVSLTFEDLMGMDDLSTDWINHNFENKSNASCGIRPHQYEPSNAEQALFYASCPVLRPVRTQQKKKTKKKQRKEGRSAETSSGACPQSIVPINNQLDKKKKRSKKRPTMPMRSVSFSVKQESRAEPKKRPTMPVHSLSFSVAKETRTKPLTFPVVPRRAASFHSSFSSFHRDNLEGKERWNRREKSTSVCPVEFGASFSASAHLSSLRQKIMNEEDRQQSYEEVLDMVNMWKREQKREQRQTAKSERNDCHSNTGLAYKPGNRKTEKHQGTLARRKKEKEELDAYFANAFKRNLACRLALDIVNLQ